MEFPMIKAPDTIKPQKIILSYKQRGCGHKSNAAFAMVLGIWNLATPWLKKVRTEFLSIPSHWQVLYTWDSDYHLWGWRFLLRAVAALYELIHPVHWTNGSVTKHLLSTYWILFLALTIEQCVWWSALTQLWWCYGQHSGGRGKKITSLGSAKATWHDLTSPLLFKTMSK